MKNVMVDCLLSYNLIKSTNNINGSLYTLHFMANYIFIKNALTMKILSVLFNQEDVSQLYLMK